jgi:hypothetical protein
MTELLFDCKVLTDLVDADYRLDPAAIQTFVSEFTPDQWPSNSKIALVSTPQIQQQNQILLLAASLPRRGYKGCRLFDSKSAIS